MNLQHHCRTDNSWNCQADDDRSTHADFGSNPTADENDNQLDCSEWCVEEDGSERVISKSLDDQGTEGCNSTTGDAVISLGRAGKVSLRQEQNLRDANDDEKPTVGLQVHKHLPEMVPSPFSGNDTHLIGSETFYGNVALVPFPEFGFNR